MQNIAATCIEKNGIGLLIVGPSGIGKSSLALKLIDEGAFLISDDRTLIIDDRERLTATVPETIQQQIEVRGIGVISGLPYKKETIVSAVVHLIDTEPERMPSKVYTKVCGQEILTFSFYNKDFSLTNKVNLVIRLLKKEVFFVAERRNKC